MICLRNFNQGLINHSKFFKLIEIYLSTNTLNTVSHATALTSSSCPMHPTEKPISPERWSIE